MKSMRNQRWVMSVVCLLAAMGFVTQSHAEGGKIGVLNLQKIFAESPQIQKINAQLEKEFKPRQEKLKQEADQLKSDMEKLNRDGSVMKDSERDELQGKIVKMRRQLQDEQQDLESDAGQAQQKSMQSFLDILNKKLEEFAVKNKYDLILRLQGVPYASKDVDVTNQIVEMLKH
jgi:outer membrane protein